VKQKTSDSPITRRKRYRSANGTNRVYRDGYRYKLKQKIVLSDGREIVVVGSGKTRSQCEENTKRLCKRKLAQSGEAANKRESLADYCQHWIDNVKEYDGTKNNTLTSYRTALSKRIRPLTQGLDIRSVKREDIQKLYGEMQRLNLSFYVVKDVRAVICGALDEAVESGILPSNPARGVKLPPRVKKDPEYFTADEVKKIMEAATKSGLKARWMLAFYLGLRQGECLALCWEDIDFQSEPPTLKVRRTISRVTGKGLVVDTPKTPSSYRTIPLSQDLVEELKRHKKAQAQKRLIAGGRWDFRDFVFTTPSGKPIDSANDRKAWVALLKAAGVSYRKLHCARHTTATLMHSHSVPLLTISRVLGHASISTTAEFYAHVETDTKLQAINTFSSVVSE
jgi:integrase